MHFSSFFLLAFLLTLHPLLVQAKNLVGVVNKVYDGDTIQVNSLKVRLIGVDTPEIASYKKGTSDECFAREAQDFVEAFLDGQKVELKFDSTKKETTDKYGRILAYVYLDKILINALLIEKGYGLAYTFFSFEKMDEFKSLHHQAQKARLGLWEKCRVTCQYKFCKTHFLK